MPSVTKLDSPPKTNGVAVPATASTIATAQGGTGPRNAATAKAAAMTSPAPATSAPGRRVRSSTAPTIGAATMLGPSAAAARSPPSATSPNCSTASTGIATVMPPTARRGGVAATR